MVKTVIIRSRFPYVSSDGSVKDQHCTHIFDDYCDDEDEDEEDEDEDVEDYDEDEEYYYCFYDEDSYYYDDVVGSDDSIFKDCDFPPLG
jgi:hypothetical protein